MDKLLFKNFEYFLEDKSLDVYTGAVPMSSSRRHAVKKLREYASLLTSAGLQTECCNFFIDKRVDRLSASLVEWGLLKLEVFKEELDNMHWEEFELQIVAWIATFKHVVQLSLVDERQLCQDIFYVHSTAVSCFTSLTVRVIGQLIDFVEVTTKTKRNEEMMFKFLDIYEVMRDSIPVINGLFKEEEDVHSTSNIQQMELQLKMLHAKSNIEEAIFDMFDLQKKLFFESKMDALPDGSIHPITEFVVDFLERALVYANSLGEVFHKHRSENMNDGDEIGSLDGVDNQRSTFALKLKEIINCLVETMESTSQPCNDPSLSYIFILNNENYILLKLQRHPEMEKQLGNHWHSTVMGKIAKNKMNYLDDTWSKVRHCIRKDDSEGTSGHSISKLVFKERMTTFNAYFKEIIAIQSLWNISNNLLRINMKLLVEEHLLLGYTQFINRGRLYLGPMSDRYIKYEREDIRDYIDELFEGRPSSIKKR